MKKLMKKKELMLIQKSIDLVLFSVSSPVLCGIYEDLELKEDRSFECKSMDALTEILYTLRDRKINRIFYAKGPGSFTAIKLTHIFLQTLKIASGVEIFSTDAFYFNSNAPIKAFGNQYFVKKENEEIMLESFENGVVEQVFALPQKIHIEDFSIENQPLYVLPPI